MFYKFLLLILIAGFISACATKPKDTASTKGSGSEAVETDPASGDSEILKALENTELGGPNIEPGSQEDLIVNVGDRVFFGYDSAELDGDAQELLQDQVAWLKQYPGVSLTVEGHCDERGTREYNLALGEQRATAVRDYLVIEGIDADRLRVISYGKEKPAVIGSNDMAWSKNRRAVTTID